MELLTSISYRDGYVFRNALGKPISQQAFNDVWRNLLDDIGKRKTERPSAEKMLKAFCHCPFPL
jgi:DNA/RNA-binding domain of Phe-tRNA-synthetase-like protein